MLSFTHYDIKYTLWCTLKNKNKLFITNKKHMFFNTNLKHDIRFLLRGTLRSWYPQLIWFGPTAKNNFFPNLAIFIETVQNTKKERKKESK